MSIPFQHTDAGRVKDGFIDENYDCTVRSFALATDISYTKSHKLFANAGRQNGDGIYFADFMKEHRPDILHLNLTLKVKQVNEYVKICPFKNLIVRIYGHVFCIKNNVILDINCFYEYATVIDIWVFDND